MGTYRWRNRSEVSPNTYIYIYIKKEYIYIKKERREWMVGGFVFISTTSFVLPFSTVKTCLLCAMNSEAFFFFFFSL